MRKIICSLFALTLLPTFMSGAHAACFVERNETSDVSYDYVVYFKHDFPKPGRTFCAGGASISADGCCGNDSYDAASGKCKSASGNVYDSEFVNIQSELADGSQACIKNLFDKLRNISLDNNARILLVATADKTGAHAYNDALSKRRLDLVKQLFAPAARDRMITHLAGETNDNFSGTSGRNQDERTVRIIVAYGPAAPQKIDEIRKQYTVRYGAGSTISVNIDKSFSSGNRIRNAARAMEELTRDLDKSVWKTADGNFNGARLASDSIAGVVLGTAGGLITSNVVKKNQLKHGFEDIKCTIGGQSVAEFGDDFSVGIK